MMPAYLNHQALFQTQEVLSVELTWTRHRVDEDVYNVALGQPGTLPGFLLN